MNNNLRLEKSGGIWYRKDDFNGKTPVIPEGTPWQEICKYNVESLYKSDDYKMFDSILEQQDLLCDVMEVNNSVITPLWVPYIESIRQLLSPYILYPLHIDIESIVYNFNLY